MVVYPSHHKLQLVVVSLAVQIDFVCRSLLCLCHMTLDSVWMDSYFYPTYYYVFHCYGCNLMSLGSCQIELLTHTLDVKCTDRLANVERLFLLITWQNNSKWKYFRFFTNICLWYFALKFNIWYLILTSDRTRTNPSLALRFVDYSGPLG